MASWSDSTPAKVAAVISPTEWPAVTATVPVGPSGKQDRGGREPGADDEGLGDRGVLDGLGVRGRAVRDEVESGHVGQGLADRSRKAGSSSQGARKPGVWEPCPGQTIASTVPALRSVSTSA